INKKKIIGVKTKEGRNKPYYLDGIAYMRTGTESPVIASDELERIILKKNKIQWDSEICEDATLEDIDEKAVGVFKEQYENINKIIINGSNKKLLNALNCIREFNGDIKITNAGILLFGKEPKKFFLMDYVTVVRYPGKNRAQTYLDIKDFYGNLFVIVDSVNEYIKQHVQEISHVVEGQIPRNIIPQYPYFAIRELITNAVVHRDYTNIGSRIIIRMFKDRIEFSSPGSLPANVTVENIVDEQYSRNSIIAEVFNKVRYIEKLGEGWDKIMSAVMEHPFKPKLPDIRDTGNTVIVMLFSPKEELLEQGVEYTEQSKNSLERFGPIIEQLGERQVLAIKHVIKERKITSRAYGKINKVSERTARNDIRDLVDKGILKKLGTAQATYYIIKDPAISGNIRQYPTNDI
ncbi:MAG: hypothetical protein KAI55_03905, partial [Candidatus Aenigmarchaeota archaeon]|nr:hypothetical protein [Candidatus Aenigmarchaeota archaeon]